MPKLKQKSIMDTLDNIMRGHELVVPEKLKTAASNGGAPRAAATDSESAIVGTPEHQLLRTMRYRGGSYAIMMCFQRHAPNGEALVKDQIERWAQPFCDEAMTANHFAGRDFGAWKSIETLTKYGLVHRISNYAQRAANGFRGCQKDQFRLATPEGPAFIRRMMAKFGAEGAGPMGTSGPSSFGFALHFL